MARALEHRFRRAAKGSCSKSCPRPPCRIASRY